MKKITYFLPIFLLPVLVFGQQKISLDVMFSPDYAYAVRYFTQEGKELRGLIDYKKRDKLHTSFRAGVNLNYALTPRFHLKTGLRWVSLGYQNSMHYGTYVPGDLTNDRGPNIGGEKVKIQRITNFWYLELPIVGRWQWNGKRLTPFVEAGIAPHLYLTSHARLITATAFESAIIRTVSPTFRQIQWVSTASVGLQVKTARRLSLFAQPIFRYHVNPIFKYTFLKENLYSFAIEAGVRWALR